MKNTLPLDEFMKNASESALEDSKERLNQFQTAKKERLDQANEATTWLTKFPILVLENIFPHFDRISQLLDLYEADPILERIVSESAIVTNVEEKLYNEDNEERFQETMQQAKEDFYESFVDDFGHSSGSDREEDFCPYTGYYMTGMEWKDL